MSRAPLQDDHRFAVGLMSGTSADGIDAAVVRVRGRGLDMRVEVVGHTAVPFEPAMRERIRRAADPRTGTVDHICRLNFDLGERFASAASSAIAEAGLTAEQVTCIGSHGQTIYHMPPSPLGAGATLQIGEPSVIAARTGITTVADFRPADIAAGGQGAPLVPFADFVMFRSAETSRILQNIGGIANLTWLPKGGGLADVLAFDTGPGNGLIDAAVRRMGGGPDGCGYDRDGRIAAAGEVRAAWLDRWLADPYFGRRPPKSTGLEAYGDGWLRREIEAHPEVAQRPEDLVASLTALTAETIFRAVKEHLPTHPPLDEVVVCGGGALNPVLMAGLRRRFACPVRTIRELGVGESAKEAVCFALLALATIDGVAGNVPGATGAGRPAILGKICPAR